NGTLTVRVYATNRSVRGLLASSISDNWGSSGNILSIRDTPADSFDVTIDSTGGTSEDDLDIVAVGWAEEPTGLGPQAITTIKVGDSGSVKGETIGFVPLLFTDGGTYNTFRGGSWTGLSTSSPNQTSGFANVI